MSREGEHTTCIRCGRRVRDGIETSKGWFHAGCHTDASQTSDPDHAVAPASEAPEVPVSSGVESSGSEHVKDAPLLTEVLTLSDEALVAFVDFIRLNHPTYTRDPAVIRRVFAAYVLSDLPPAESGDPS